MTARFLMAVGAALVAGTAQADVCSNLQQQYLAAGQSGGGASGAVNVAALNNSLQTAQASAVANRCTGGGFFGLFGPAPSPACPLINQEVNRLQAQIRQAYSNGGGQGGGMFGGGFLAYANAPAPRDVIRQQLAANGCTIPQSGFGSGGYKTICVRTCDGYYFPLEYGASSSNFKSDAQACQAAYGNDPASAQLFVMPTDGDVASATPASGGGKAYGAQPYAFKYRTEYNQACAAQLQSGVAALVSRAPAPATSTTATPAAQPPRAATAPSGDPLAIPQARPRRFEDPETTANAAGGLDPGATEALVASTGVNNGMRIVGAGYYNLILEQQARADRAPATAAPATQPTN
jgi:hypothetical protein